MAYSSSTVTKGRAKGVVVATGMNTSIGAIATSLRGGDSKVRKVRRNEDGHAPWHRYPAAWALTTMDIIGQFLGTNVGTPLQRTLSWLAISLFGIGCLFALFCFAANDFQGKNEIILCVINLRSLRSTGLFGLTRFDGTHTAMPSPPLCP